MSSSRFAMALHALAVLARTPDEVCRSAYLAGSVNTHAAFLRRVLADLVRAGLVQTAEGRNGGYRIARPPERITLAEIYRAVEEGGPLVPCPAEPNIKCPVGRGMRGAFEEVAQSAELGLLSALERRTVADVADRAVRIGETK